MKMADPRDRLAQIPSKDLQRMYRPHRVPIEKDKPKSGVNIIVVGDSKMLQTVLRMMCG